MIIVDLNSLIIKDIVQLDKINENLIRHISINSLKNIIRKFKFNYSLNVGVVLADDDRHSWRKDYFKYYKVNRKNSRRNSKFNWNEIYEWLGIIKEEISIYLPVKYMKVPNCEADDIIAIIASFVVDRLQEDVLIVSSDTDFVQLHSTNIFQYSPFNKSFIRYENSSTLDLYDKIFRGDRGDGIPNYLSDDDVFVNPNKKSVRISNKRIYELLNGGDISNIYENLYDNEKHGFLRNKKLIDFSEIPKEISTSIINTFRNVIHQEERSMLALVGYLKEHNLNYLLSKIGDFEE